ncbi:MAG: hypothetical protein AB8F78_01710 [Saprospiraceae bacterium]
MLKRALPWILLLSGWIALAAWICAYFFCPDTAMASNTNVRTATSAVAAAIPTVKSGVWNYSDGSNFSMANDEYFKFPENEYGFVKPLTGKFS